MFVCFFGKPLFIFQSAEQSSETSQHAWETKRRQLIETVVHRDTRTINVPSSSSSSLPPYIVSRKEKCGKKTFNLKGHSTDESDQLMLTHYAITSHTVAEDTDYYGDCNADGCM